jgi:hypothetical protein
MVVFPFGAFLSPTCGAFFVRILVLGILVRTRVCHQFTINGFQKHKLCVEGKASYELETAVETPALGTHHLAPLLWPHSLRSTCKNCEKKKLVCFPKIRHYLIRC